MEVIDRVSFLVAEVNYQTKAGYRREGVFWTSLTLPPSVAATDLSPLSKGIRYYV